jgi:hypothetical protein
MMGEDPIHLLLDSYPEHRTREVRATAAGLGITLGFISPGLTDEFQTVDRVVFGVLKSHAKRLFHERFRLRPYQRRTKRDAVSDMLIAWELLG